LYIYFYFAPQRKSVHAFAVGYIRKTRFSVLSTDSPPIGSFVSLASISKAFKADNLNIDNKTVTIYLDYLASAFLFYKFPRYDKGKNILRTLDKYYVADTGFRKARHG
jgi:predicted AAA+ superfamily ATPase